MTAFCGSLYYLSPEVLVRSYTINCDLWCVGIITYSLLTGTFPYFGDNEDEMYFEVLQKVVFTEEAK